MKKKINRVLSFALSLALALGCVSFTSASVSAVDDNTLFYEAFDTSPGSGATTYDDKAMTWTVPAGASWNHDGDDGTAGRILCANGNYDQEWKFAFDEGYTGAMLLKVTAELDAGAVADNCKGRIDIWSDNDPNGNVQRLTLCYFEGGRIYANCMNADEAHDTGVAYTVGHRYIVTGVIDEAARSFKLSVYDKTDDAAVLTDYNVVPYKHSKTNWAEMTSGFKGAAFIASRPSGVKPVYALYNIKVENVPTAWTVTESNVTLTDADGAVQSSWNSVSASLSTVAIDFGTGMDESTLTETGVYIENAATGDIVSYTGAYENNIYTLTLGTALEEGTVYNIVITDAVKTSSGMSNAENVIFSFATAAAAEIDENTLFYETFDTSGYNSKTEYNGKEGTWTIPAGASWNHDGDNGTAGRILCANGNYDKEWKFTFNEGYTDAMLLKVTAELDAGAVADNCKGRIDIWSDTDPEGNVQRLTLCYFEGGRIYANCMNADEARDTGATYTDGHRYIVTGTIDEAARSFKLSVYDKTDDAAVLTDYNVVPYKHSKTNWAEMTSGFKGAAFIASRPSGVRPVYALYNIKVEDMPVSWDVTEYNVILSDSNNNIQPFNGASVLTSKIAIDFGIEMDQSSLADSNIYLENDSDGSRIVYNGEYSDNVYTMNLTDSLEQGTRYNIVIGSSVKTAEGVMNGSPTVISFTTAGGAVVDNDDSFDREFTFDDLDGWTGNGATIVDGRLVAKNDTPGEKRMIYKYAPVYKDYMTLEVSYDLYPGSNQVQSRIQLDGNMGYIVLANFDGGNIYANTYDSENPIGAVYETGKLYKVKCLIDQKENILKVSVYDENGTALVTDHEISRFGGNNGRGAGIVGLKQIIILNSISSPDDIAPQIDNLKIREIYAAPRIGADSVSIGISGGPDASDLAAVDPISNVVTLNFGTALDVATLSDESIRILKDGTTPIATAISYSNRLVTVALNESLAANTKYVISVSGDIANKDGVTLGDAAAVEFTTTAGGTTAAIGRILVDNNEVASLSQLNNGDKLSVEVDYTNSTKETKTIYMIVAAYNGYELVDANYITKDVDASITRKRIRLESEAVYTDQVTTMKVMLWDGFDSMHPLSPCKTID